MFDLLYYLAGLAPVLGAMFATRGDNLAVVELDPSLGDVL